MSHTCSHVECLVPVGSAILRDNRNFRRLGAGNKSLGDKGVIKMCLSLLLHDSLLLSASWLAWSEQPCSSTPFCHDVLHHHIEAGQAWTEISETKNENKSFLLYIVFITGMEKVTETIIFPNNSLRKIVKDSLNVVSKVDTRQRWKLKQITCCKLLHC
jgi:hypothetical protein